MITLTDFECAPVPAALAKCPICNAPLYVMHCDEWEEDGDYWKPTHISVECETEPDIDHDHWEKWHARHYRMPYVDWLPVDQKVLAWYQSEYRYKF